MIVEWVQRYALLGLGGALVLSMVATGVQTVRHQSAVAQVEKGKTELSELREKWTEQALAATNQIRGLEAQLTAQAQENQDALLKEREAVRTAAAGFAAERKRVRDTIARFASGSGLSPDVAAATCSDRATRLGRGLDETLRAEESLVGELEDQRADTRTLLRDGRAVRALISTDRAAGVALPPVR